jgi:hypothetical protein
MSAISISEQPRRRKADEYVVVQAFNDSFFSVLFVFDSQFGRFARHNAPLSGDIAQNVRVWSAERPLSRLGQICRESRVMLTNSTPPLISTDLA